MKILLHTILAAERGNRLGLAFTCRLAGLCILLNSCRSTSQSNGPNPNPILTLPEDVDEIVVAEPGMRTPVYTIQQAGLAGELAALKIDDPSIIEVHECIGSAWIYFKSDGEVVRIWQFAHGRFWVPGELNPDAGKRLAHWFDAKGVPEFVAWLGTEEGFSTSEIPVLERIRLSQHPNGSWHSPSASPVFTTAWTLELMAWMGELDTSKKYGKSVQHGLDWLLKQSPTNDLDMVCMLNTLNSQYRATRYPVMLHEAKGLHQVVGARNLSEPANTLFQLMKPCWAPLQPLENRRSKGQQALEALFISTTKEERTDPVFFYLHALLKFTEGPEAWKTYHSEELKPLIEQQNQSMDHDTTDQQCDFLSVLVANQSAMLYDLDSAVPVWLDIDHSAWRISGSLENVDPDFP